MIITIYFTADTKNGPFQIIKPTIHLNTKEISDLVKTVTSGKFHGYKIEK